MTANKILARDVRERVKGKCDFQVQYCLEALAETHGLIEKRMDELEKQLIDLLRLLNALTDNAVNLGEVVYKIDRQRKANDGGPTVT